MKVSQAKSVMKRVCVTPAAASYMRPLPEELSLQRPAVLSIDLDASPLETQKLFDLRSVYSKRDLPSYSVLSNAHFNTSSMLLSASSDDSASDSETDSESESDVFSRQGSNGRNRKNDYEESDDEDNDFFGGIMIPIPKIPWPFQVGGSNQPGSAF